MDLQHVPVLTVAALTLDVVSQYVNLRSLYLLVNTLLVRKSCHVLSRIYHCALKQRDLPFKEL